MKHYDVVIAGGGIAGAFLARQLRLQRPELAILLLEAASKIDNFKVGESTVEVAAHYMVKRLKLGTYLYQHQLPKNGLRFFFDSPDKDLPLVRMSEIGSDHMPFHPSFQLERAALERDVLEMNRKSGVDVRLSAKVVEVDVATREKGPHKVVFEEGGERKEVTCRWLCDAAGRRHLLARKLGLKITKEARLNTGACWARYWNVAGLDAETDPAWRARVRHTSRHLSTNHMMYDGYWIWFIPLAGDLMSVGAVFDKDIIGQGPRNRQELEAFLNGHRSSRDLMRDAVFEDCQAYAHLPYWSEQFFSGDRWGLVGEAGAFPDPFYSPGSDFIATGNELLGSLILADLDGDPTFAERVEAYNAFYRLKYEATIRLYIKQYSIFGSYSIYRLKYLLDFNNYYNLVAWPFMADKLTDLAWLREELKFADLQVRAIGALGEHFFTLGKVLKERGDYFRENEGQWANGLNGVVQFQEKLGPVLDEAFRRQQLDRAYASVFAALLERVNGLEGFASRERLLSELNLPMVLALKDVEKDALGRLLPRLGQRLAKDLRAEFPAVEKVSLERHGDAIVPIVEGALDDDAGAKARSRACELWDRRGQSLVDVRL